MLIRNMPWWFWVGFLLLLMIGIIVIVYYLYGTKQEEGFQTTAPTTGPGPENRQVYVPYQNGTWDQGSNICKSLGGRYATMAELRDALRGGASWNVLGFIGETKKQTYAPQQSPLTSGILSYIPGVENMANRPTIVRRFGGAYGKDTSYKDGFSSEFQSVNCSGSGIMYDIDLHGGDTDVVISDYPICYGVRPTSSQYNIVNFNGNSVSDPRHTPQSLESILAYNSYTVPGSTNGSVPNTFDRAPTAQTLGSYTILDLEALDAQKTIMVIDALEIQKDMIEKEILASSGREAILQEPIVNNPEISKTANSVISEFIEYLDTNVNVMVANFIKKSMIFYNPTGASSPQPYTIASLLAKRRENIVNYYLYVLELLNMNPVGFIQNSIMNEMVYLNAIQPASSMWEISGDYKSKKLSCNGIGTKDYNYNAGSDIWNHCPGGNWCFDSYDTPLIWDGCRSGYNRDEWHGYGGKIGPCIREYFNFRQNITRVDVDLGARPPTCTYDSSFFLPTDGWQPKTCSPSSKLVQNNIITRFTNQKTITANRYGKTSQADIKSTYRWKPITYYGTVSPTNISEVRKSMAISIIFNFNNYTDVESQIRISSKFPYDLYYSPNGAGKPEYTEKLEENTLKIKARNSVYNETYSNTPFTRELLDLLPFQTRQFIANWATIRKDTTMNWEAQIISTMSTTAMKAIYDSIANDSDPQSIVTGCVLSVGQVSGTTESPKLSKIDKTSALYACVINGINTSLATNTVYQDIARVSTLEGTKINSDLSANFFATDADINDTDQLLQYSYRRSWFDIEPVQEPYRRKILNQMAQLYYTKKEGRAKIQTVYDIFQVGSTLFDVYYSGTDTGSGEDYTSSISTLNANYYNYRRYNLSQQEIDSLELTYNNELEILYSLQAQNLEGNAEDCGIKAQFVQIQYPASPNNSSRTAAALKLSQVVVIDNTGMNVALGTIPVATSTYLASYENEMIPQSFKDVTKPASREALDEVNKYVIRDKLICLTDGTYAPRYYPFWQNGIESDGTAKTLSVSELEDYKYGEYERSYESGYNSSANPMIGVTKVSPSPALTAYEYLELNLYGAYDISVVQLFYPPSNSIEFPQAACTVQLFDRNHIPIPNDSKMQYDTTTRYSKQFFSYNGSGSTIVDFRRPNRDLLLPQCPTNMYTRNRVARFYADPAHAGPITSENSIVFTGFSEGPDAALTFNPLYNAGFYVRTDNRYGSIMYNPTTVFDLNLVPTILPCTDPERIKTIFKDYQLLMASYDFLDRADVKELQQNGQYNPNNTFVVDSVSSVTNAYDGTKDINTICYYTWTENEYGEAESTDLAGLTVTQENIFLNSYKRSGAFVYASDTENWNSQNIVMNFKDSYIYKSESPLTITKEGTGITTYYKPPTDTQNDYLKYAATMARNDGVIPSITPIAITPPYFDSTTLGKGGTCPGDCSNPSIINSIITDYNSRMNIPYNEGGLLSTGDPVIKGGAIIRVEKALTNTSQSCIYVFSTMGAPADFKTQQAEFTIQPDGLSDTCKYKITNIKRANKIIPSAPFLTEIYHYITDTMIPYTNTLYSAYGVLSSLIRAHTNETNDGIVSDVIQYRTDTYKAAGQIRKTPLGVLNENGDLCDDSRVQATSPLIINGFLNLYRSRQPDGPDNVITQILGVGMISSLTACDFSYETAPITFTGGTPTINMAQAQTAGLRASIVRYPNSCAYTVNPSKPFETILPVPSLSDVMNPLYIRYDTVFDFSKVPVTSTTNATQMGTAITSAGISSVVNTTGSPFKTLGYSNQFLESIDYINCKSFYAINAIKSLNITPIAVAQNESKSCIVKTQGGSETVYTFSKPALPSMNTLAPQLYANPQQGGAIGATQALTTIGSNPTGVNYGNDPANFCTANNNQSAITGLTGVVEAMPTSTTTPNVCEYKISLDYTIPFGEMYKRATFYTGNLQTPEGTDVHLTSLVPATVTDSPFRYFTTTRTPTQVTDTTFMTILKYLRYTWNKKFYEPIDTTNPPTGWKIGIIKNVYVLNTDTVILNATGCNFGQYGELDIRNYSENYWFYFDLRYKEGTPNFSVYKQYHRDNGPSSPLRSFSISSQDDEAIATYNNTNYKNKDTSSYRIISIDSSLKAGGGNRYRLLRFSVKSTKTASPIAEITRILFYEDTMGTPKYEYIEAELRKGAVAFVSDVSANYLLSDSGKNICDKNYQQGTESKNNVCILDYSINRTQFKYPGANDNTKNRLFPCPIGYTTYPPDNIEPNSTCRPNGFYQNVIQDPSLLFNPGVGTPRLHLNVGAFDQTSDHIKRPGKTLTQPKVTQTLTIRFNTAVRINAYTFITGSPGRAPTAWTLEGSINGEFDKWVTIDSRSGFDYSNTVQSARSANGQVFLSFYNPGVFELNYGINPTSLSKYYNLSNVKGEGIYNVQVSIYTQTNTNIAEGFSGNSQESLKPPLKESFQAPLLDRRQAMDFTTPAVSLKSAYNLPMKQGSHLADLKDTTMNISKRDRIQYLRFITIETYDSNSKFVNMSKLEFHTRKGVVPPACIKLSNSQGSRKSPKDGVNSILGSKSQRWVDYNKSEILIQFDLEILPAEPISGFKFSIPDLEGGLGACPRKWQLLGSYDKHNWKLLHNQQDPVKNPALYTMVHTFTQEI